MPRLRAELRGPGRHPDHAHRRGPAARDPVLTRLGVLLALGGTLLALLPAPAASQGAGEPPAPGTDCCLLLLIPVGARSSSLGGTLTARNGPQTLFRNPAGVAALESDVFMIHHSDEPLGVQIDAFSLLFTPWSTTAGLSYQLFDSGSVITTDRQGQPTGELSIRNHLLVATFATPIGAGLSAGLNYKFYQERVDCTGVCGGEESVATTHGADLGLHYSPRWHPPLQLGLSLLNAGFPLQVENAAQADAFPARLHTGAAYNVLAGLGADSLLSLWVAVNLEDELQDLGSPVASVGVEIDMQEVIFLRAGYTPGEGLGTGAAVGVELRYDRFDIALARPFVNSTLEADTEPFQISFGVRF